jgi:hypothetical protein
MEHFLRRSSRITHPETYDEIGREGTVQVWVEGPSGEEGVRIAGSAPFVKDITMG